MAVLRLDYPVDYRANILPICLPPDNADYTGYVAVVAGWGKTDNSFSGSRKLTWCIGSNCARVWLGRIKVNDQSPKADEVYDKSFCENSMTQLIY